MLVNLCVGSNGAKTAALVLQDPVEATSPTLDGYLYVYIDILSIYSHLYTYNVYIII